jgi:putative inorganic carbon (HCO3(-)) transporter
MSNRLETAALIDPAWSEGLRQAAPARLLRTIGDRWHGLSADWVAGSWLGQVLPMLRLVTLCLLLAISPYVGTGLNAALVLLAAGVATLDLLLFPRRPVAADGLLVPVFAYMIMGAVAMAFSSYPLLAAKGLAKMGIFMLAFWAFYRNLDARTWRIPVLAMIAGASGIALHGIYQWTIKVPPLALWDDAGSLGHITRVYSFLRNPNLLAGYLLPTMALTIGASLQARGLWRWAGLGSAAVQSLCLYFTYSRGGWLGMIAVWGVFAAVALWRERARLAPYKKHLAVAAVVAVALMVVAVMSSPALTERLASMVTVRGHSSNSYRANVWTAVFRMIGDTWPIGIGPGNDVFKRIYPLYMLSGFDALGAYNIFLEVFVEMGIVGIGAFVWLFLAHLARQAWGVRQGWTDGRSWMLAACLAATLAIAVHGMVDTVFYRPQVSILFWLVLAMTAKLSQPTTERQG